MRDIVYFGVAGSQARTELNCGVLPAGDRLRVRVPWDTTDPHLCVMLAHDSLRTGAAVRLSRWDAAAATYRDVIDADCWVRVEVGPPDGDDPGACFAVIEFTPTEAYGRAPRIASDAHAAGAGR
jgi:hypothetical protein